jgi:hypothetical protein
MEDEAMEMMAGEAVGTKRNLIFVLLICFLAVSSWLVWKGDPDAVRDKRESMLLNVKIFVEDNVNGTVRKMIRG